MKKINQATPIILSIIAVIGVAATAYTAVKETPEAEKRKKKAQENKRDELTTVDKVVLNAKCYKKTIAFGTGTAACIIGSCVLNKRNQALLATAYPILEQSYRQYKDKVKEIFGVGAHRKVESEIAKDVVRAEAPTMVTQDIRSCSLDIPNDEDEIIRTFYDTLSQRYFESTLVDVLQAEYHLNRNFSLGDPVPENMWYEFLGIDGVVGGDNKFWYICDDGLFWIDFDHHKTIVDDMEVIMVDVCIPPRFNEDIAP